MSATVKRIIILSTIIVIIVIVVAVFMRIISPLSQKEIKKDFVKNYNYIIIVTNYFINSEYDDIYINKTMGIGIMFTSTYGDVYIDDTEVAKAIGILKLKGYSAIGKEGSTIYFQRSTRLMDFGNGVAYSIDGSEPQLQFLTKLEPLSKPNWYYYEEDFNEWKKRNE